jgi:hypothetical protein
MIAKTDTISPAKRDVTVEAQRAIQRDIDAKDKAKGKTPNPRPMQAGTRPYPVLRSKDNLAKPGKDADLSLQPRGANSGVRWAYTSPAHQVSLRLA